MSYLVLARKYRPMFFEDVVGQQHVSVTLQNAIQQNRIANAYLFSGPRGVGKTTVARLLSKALNCDQGPTIKPCNACSSCKEVNESRSLDVLEIDGASNRGIDEVRNLRESLKYSPNPGKHRIYIIDEVHMLTNEAFNALLKTLEEPPSRVLFIFATTEPHKVPATILSRCQRFDFKRLTNVQIVEQLQQLCEKETIQVDDESLRLIATKGDGSMRDSQSILDQIIAFAGTTITADATANLLGIINHDLFFRVTDLIAANDVRGGIELVQQIFAEGYDFNEFLIGLSEHLRNIMVVQTTSSTAELNVSEDHARRYQDITGDFEVEDLLRLVKIATDAENLIRRSANARLHLEVALVKMIKLTKSVQLSQLLEHYSDKKKSNDSISRPQHSQPPDKDKTVSPPPTVPPATPTSSQDASKAPVETSPEPSDDEIQISLDDIEEKWQDVVQEVKKRQIGLGSMLMEGWPTRLKEKILEVSFGEKNGFQMDTVMRNHRVVEGIIQEILKARLGIRCVKASGDQLEKVRKFPARVDKHKEFEKLQQSNKMVKTIVDTLDAELIHR